MCVRSQNPSGQALVTCAMRAADKGVVLPNHVRLRDKLLRTRAGSLLQHEYDGINAFWNCSRILGPNHSKS